jgi:hypothetical protein
LIQPLDYFRLFQPCPVLHGSTKIPAQYWSVDKVFCQCQLRQIVEFEMGWESHCRDADA